MGPHREVPSVQRLFISCTSISLPCFFLKPHELLPCHKELDRLLLQVQGSILSYGILSMSDLLHAAIGAFLLLYSK